MKLNLIRCYKLVERKPDGSFGPLFVDKRSRFKPGAWYHARFDLNPSGLANRPGIHACLRPYAPHIKAKPNRVWLECYAIESECSVVPRPECQGGDWLLCRSVFVIRPVNGGEHAQDNHG